ncbi:MAG: ATP-binding protein [Pirellula sp.]
MLVSFSVRNYRSFGDEVTLNMVASNKLTDHPQHRVEIDKSGKYLVRSAVLYGANAAGKSNLVKAMGFAQGLIQQQHDQLPIVENFRFSAELAKEPSSFEFRFLVGECVFVYGFDVSTRKISSEWLSYIDGDDEPLVFERNEAGRTEVNSKALEYFVEDKQLSLTLDNLKQLPIKPNQLFLSRVVSLPEEAQGKTLNRIVNWLTEELQVIGSNHRSCDLLERLDRDDAFRQFSAQFLDRIDTGIHGLRFEQSERELSDIEREVFSRMGERGGYGYFGCDGDTYICPKPEDSERYVSRRLFSEHTTTKSKHTLPFGEESDGTQQILHYLPVLSTHNDQTKVIVIDELDRSLHPLLCWEFIRFFSESCPGARKQLIVTTHESHLLNQELLRRDEYWFVEKDKDQQSRLSSLSDYNVRNDLKIQKGYLQGRFGAIPVVGGLSELVSLFDCGVKEGENAKEKTPA